MCVKSYSCSIFDKNGLEIDEFSLNTRHYHTQYIMNDYFTDSKILSGSYNNFPCKSGKLINIDKTKLEETCNNIKLQGYYYDEELEEKINDKLDINCILQREQDFAGKSCECIDLQKFTMEEIQNMGFNINFDFQCKVINENNNELVGIANILFNPNAGNLNTKYFVNDPKEIEDEKMEISNIQITIINDKLHLDNNYQLSSDEIFTCVSIDEKNNLEYFNCFIDNCEFKTAYLTNTPMNGHIFPLNILLEHQLIEI